MEASQRRGQVQRDDCGTDRDLEGERRQGQCHRRPHGALDPIAVQQPEQTDDDQHPDHGRQATMEELNGRIAIEGEAEAAATERPRIAGAAGATADHQRTAEDQ